MKLIRVKDKTEHQRNIKIARFKKDVRITQPHKHNNYFEIIYLSEASGTHTIDMETYSIQPPMVFLIRKDQMHCWDIKSEPEGFVVIIKKSFVDDSLDLEMKHLFSEISKSTCIYPKDAKIIEQILELMTIEYDSTTEIQNNMVLEGLLKALLAKLIHIPKSKRENKTVQSTLFDHFKSYLKQSDQLVNNVAHYASLLNTTPQNLNAICRTEVQMSASAFLSEYIIIEAKRLLVYTDLTITEVGMSLGFRDNSHFTKYFKRFTQLTPTAFRSQL